MDDGGVVACVWVHEREPFVGIHTRKKNYTYTAIESIERDAMHLFGFYNNNKNIRVTKNVCIL